MMNKWIVTGNLVDVPTYVAAADDKKAYMYGKIGVYNGKDKDGNPNDSMFVSFITYSEHDMEVLKEKAAKGDRVMLIGNLGENKTTDKDGKEYINKKVICESVSLLVKLPKQDKAPVQDPTGW